MLFKSFNHSSDDYPVRWQCAEESEILVDPVTNDAAYLIGEPEDRTFSRDLRKLVDLLNKDEE